MEFAKHTLFFCWLALWQNVDGVVNNGHGVKNLIRNYNRHQGIFVNKVSLTQKGYIQFLRYIADVPPITDYTFCIWVKSNNITYSHPLLSYSKHEKQRLIRLWISPRGTHINLEILEHALFEIPVNFMDNHWYNICQSWSSYHAVWNFYLDAKLKLSGYEPQLQGVRIEGGGDIVVGQEYTDFDKGLEDGIEGDVFGFNFVLSPTFLPSHDHHHLKESTTQSIFDISHVSNYFPLEEVFFDFFNRRQERERSYKSNKRKINRDDKFITKTSGMMLVELSHNCVLGRGAPLEGKDVLISWTKTPVRVFGGAVLKNVWPFCHIK